MLKLSVTGRSFVRARENPASVRRPNTERASVGKVVFSKGRHDFLGLRYTDKPERLGREADRRN